MKPISSLKDVLGEIYPARTLASEGMDQALEIAVISAQVSLIR